MAVPGATTLFNEGDRATLDAAAGTWRNDTTGVAGTSPRLPQLVLDILASGGVLPRLAEPGYLPAELADLLRSNAVRAASQGSGA